MVLYRETEEEKKGLIANDNNMGPRDANIFDFTTGVEKGLSTGVA